MAEAERLMQEGLATPRTMANYSVSVRYLLSLGDVALHTGETGMARRYLDEAAVVQGDPLT